MIYLLARYSQLAKQFAKEHRLNPNQVSISTDYRQLRRALKGQPKPLVIVLGNRIKNLPFHKRVQINKLLDDKNATVTKIEEW